MTTIPQTRTRADIKADLQRMAERRATCNDDIESEAIMVRIDDLLEELGPDGG